MLKVSRFHLLIGPVLLVYGACLQALLILVEQNQIILSYISLQETSSLTASIRVAAVPPLLLLLLNVALTDVTKSGLPASYDVSWCFPRLYKI